MPTLALLPPNQLSYDGRAVPIGATVYLAVRALLDSGGRMPRADLCRAVWSREASPRALWSLCHRINERLAGIGYPERCGVDAGDVLLC